MYVGRDFDPADPGENRILSFDFTKDLAPGETILSVSWSIVAESGPDSIGTQQAALIGPAGIAGAVVSQKFGNWVAGSFYEVTAIAHTSLLQDLPLFAHILCENPTQL